MTRNEKLAKAIRHRLAKLGIVAPPSDERVIRWVTECLQEDLGDYYHRVELLTTDQEGRAAGPIEVRVPTLWTLEGPDAFNEPTLILTNRRPS